MIKVQKSFSLFSRKVTIKPSNSFIESIEIKGTDATYKMQDNATLYHYSLSSELVRDLKRDARAGKSMGQFYNRNVKGLLQSKTVPPGEKKVKQKRSSNV